jgi:hypothetical protein
MALWRPVRLVVAVRESMLLGCPFVAVAPRTSLVLGGNPADGPLQRFVLGTGAELLLG